MLKRPCWEITSGKEEQDQSQWRSVHEAEESFRVTRENFFLFFLSLGGNILHWCCKYTPVFQTVSKNVLPAGINPGHLRESGDTAAHSNG